MPRLDRVLETSLYVADPEQSARWYEDVFGFTVVSRSERLIAMSVMNQQLLLLFKKGLSADLPKTPHDGEGQLHLAFAIPTEELPAWEAWLAQRGIVIEDKTHWERGGWSLYFRDPDGHLLEVATPGAWTVY